MKKYSFIAVVILVIFGCLALGACIPPEKILPSGLNEPDPLLEGVPVPLETLPVVIERPSSGTPLSDREIADFTAKITGFYRTSDYFRWISRHAHGVADDNPWGEPGYKIWWTNTVAVKAGDVVTFTRAEDPDNTTAKVTRVLPGIIAYYLATDSPVAGKLALDLMRGLSATVEGNIWGDEDPVVETIMARGLFHRNHSTEADGGRKIVIDYDSVRVEEFARRHDTIHNPQNPTWGDIYIRNKRSKDDFPYMYRMMFWIYRLIYFAEDEQLREEAARLNGLIRGVTRDMIEYGYVIRTKDNTGAPFIPTIETGAVDDFASLVGFENLFPRAECNAKLCTAYVAEGESLDNECGDGDTGGYEEVTIAGHFWGSNMIWGYRLAAVTLALANYDNTTAEQLLYGWAEKFDELTVDARAAEYTEWYPDVAQLLVLAAGYGLKLTNDEARLIVEQYGLGAEHYSDFGAWDLWSAEVEDGTYEYIPDRNTYLEDGTVDKTFVRITEIGDLFEYCASPLKHPDSPQFVDCETVLDEIAWGW